MGRVSFEGPIASGKTALTNLCATRLRTPKLLEDFDANPFLPAFYAALKTGKTGDIAFETEMAFLLIHSRQLRAARSNRTLVMDFLIEKDLVYARMNLRGEELVIFEQTYMLVTKDLPATNLAILLEASPEVLADRMAQRGRPYEDGASQAYLRRFAKNLETYMADETKTRVEVVNTDDLHFSKSNPTMRHVTELVRSELRSGR